MENCSSIMKAYNIGVRLDFTNFTADQFSLDALESVWRKHAEMLNKNGEIFASCSVHLLDWKRIKAFFDHFDGVSKESLEKMRDRIIMLNGSNLGLCTASPYSASDIAKGYTLTVLGGDVYCHPRLQTEADQAAVKASIVEIKKRIKEYTVLAEEAEYKLANGIGEKSIAIENVGRAKRMRFTTALAWQLNAQALKDNEKEMAEATEAVNTFIVHTNYIQQPEFF
jgi:hypothetical protein